MTRLIASFLIWLALVLFQTSFVASLPSPLSLAPIVFAVGIYVLQHLGAKDGAWWVFGVGAFLDLYRIGTMPAESVAYAFAAGVAVWSAARLFSNRSLYGVIGCAFLSLGTLHLAHAAILYGLNVTDAAHAPWAALVHLVAWQYAETLGLIALLFSFSKRTRQLLRRALILPSRGTL